MNLNSDMWILENEIVLFENEFITLSSIPNIPFYKSVYILVKKTNKKFVSTSKKYGTATIPRFRYRNHRNGDINLHPDILYTNVYGYPSCQFNGSVPKNVWNENTIVNFFNSNPNILTIVPTYSDLRFSNNPHFLSLSYYFTYNGGSQLFYEILEKIGVGNLNYYSPQCGKRLRTKAEFCAAIILYHNNIIYNYENRQLESDYVPDFFIKKQNKINKKTILEILGLTNSSWRDTNGMTYSERVVKKTESYQNDDYETIFVDVDFSCQYDSIFNKMCEEFKTKFNIELKKPSLSEYFSKYVLYGTTFEDKLKELLIKWDSGEINYDWLNKNERYFTRIIDETYGGGFRAYKELIGYPVNIPRKGKSHYDLYIGYELENINKILGFIPEPKDCFRDNFDCVLHRRMAIIYRKFGTKTFYQNGKFYNLIGAQKWNQKIINKMDKPGTKLKYDDVVYIKKNYIEGDMNFGVTPLSRKFNVTTDCISHIINGKTWRHVKI